MILTHTPVSTKLAFPVRPIEGLCGKAGSSISQLDFKKTRLNPYMEYFQSFVRNLEPLSKGEEAIPEGADPADLF